jgi:hypothetical protein
MCVCCIASCIFPLCLYDCKRQLYSANAARVISTLSLPRRSQPQGVCYCGWVVGLSIYAACMGMHEKCPTAGVFPLYIRRNHYFHLYRVVRTFTHGGSLCVRKRRDPVPPCWAFIIIWELSHGFPFCVSRLTSCAEKGDSHSRASCFECHCRLTSFSYHCIFIPFPSRLCEKPRQLRPHCRF